MQGMILKSVCCVASKLNAEQLRSQLDRLHAEANATTTKATNARLRLLRLSEAAEKLQKQAALSIQKGDENYARDMLFQRKKVLHALDKSKKRIELLDQLSAKLSQAISLKESQLIGNVTTNVEDTMEDASGPVRIVAPKDELREDITMDDSDPSMINYDVQDMQFALESEENPLDDNETQNLQESISIGSSNEDNVASSLSEISSFEDFIKHIDQKLSEIEAELVTVLNVSSLVLDNKEMPMNFRLQQTMELLEGIRAIRQRIKRTKEANLRI